MSFSKETQEKMKRFAAEQARHYLDEAEMTYPEKLRKKTRATAQKISGRLSRFKPNSDQTQEARNDMLLYMSDYMGDLMAKGLSEQEALDKAKEELAASGASEAQNSLQERFRQYYENQDPSVYETVGLFYGGFVVIGLVVGALIAFALSGGRQSFPEGGWIDTLVGTGAGMLIGVGLGQISHALIVGKARR